MKYDHFLFDADDTLFDFRKSEHTAFRSTLAYLKIESNIDAIYATYKVESAKLWRCLELGKTTKEHLRVERFKRTFASHRITVCPEKASRLYLKHLPNCGDLNANAAEVCKFLSQIGTVGIVTNGIESVQKARLNNSTLLPFISFMVVSEDCGFTKPDSRFFEYAMTKTKTATKQKTLVIGDRIETDIIGAHAFGVDSCWYNPKKIACQQPVTPHYEIDDLSQLYAIVAADN